MSLTLNSDTDIIRVGTPGWPGTGPFTCIMWHKPAAITSNRRLFDGKGTGVNTVRWNGTGGNITMEKGRATTDASRTTSTTHTAGSWICHGFTFSETNGVNVYEGTLTSTMVLATYSAEEDGAGGSDDSSGNMGIGNISGASSAAFGDYGTFIVFDFEMTLAQIQEQQFRPHVLSGCDGFYVMGVDGAGNVPDWSGNNIACTPVGVVVSDHVPLGPLFGFDLGWQGAFTAATDTPMVAAQGSFTLTGQAANTLWGHEVAAAQGSYSLTGQSAITTKDTPITAAQGSYALTGQSSNLLWKHLVAAAQGSYSLTGQSANLLWDHLIAAAQGSYALTGQAAITLKNLVPLTAAQGSYALTGQAANLLWGHLVGAVQGSYSLTGQAATTSHQQGIILTAAQGSYALTGQTANLLWKHLLTAVQGSYALMGQAAVTTKDTPITATQGAYTLTGQAAITLFDHIIVATQGGYTLTGQDAGLNFLPVAGVGGIFPRIRRRRRR